MNETTQNNSKPKWYDLSRFGEFIVHPRKVFQQIYQGGRSAWQLPMLVLSLAMILRVVVRGYLSSRAAAMGQISLPPDWEWWSPDMQNNYLQGIQTTQGPAYVYIIPAFTNLIGLWLGWPILSSILHLTSTLFGGRGSQASTLNVVAWSKLPYAMRDILRVIFMIAAGHIIGSPGLSGFATSASGFLSNLLKQVDLFLLWQLLLLAAGLYQLNGISSTKTWLAVVLVLLVALLSQAGLATIFSSLSGSVISRPFLF
jgi:hypothetical protein